MTSRKNFSKVDYEIVQTKLGIASIRHIGLNEIMHNPVGPRAESEELYVAQSQLRKRLTDPEQSSPLVLFDVGLGAAGNALAAINLAMELKEEGLITRSLKIISFEENLELLEFALENQAHFELVEKFGSVIQDFLKNGSYENGIFSWELRLGNFLDHILQEKIPPEVIFHDPYSPRSNPEMWSYYCFRQLYHLSKKSEKSVQLLTYSRATPVRVALMAAGFFVGAGQSSGLKDETTEAATQFQTLISPLGSRWFERWKRSDTPLPPLSDREFSEALNRESLMEVFECHPQFRDNPLTPVLGEDPFTKVLQKLEKATIK